MKKVDLSKFTDDELLDIEKRAKYFVWDERMGEKPFMFDEMERYKKADNISYRLKNLFRAVCPVVKYDYIKPIMIELARRNIKGFELWRPYIYSKTPLQRLQQWLTSFLNRLHRVWKAIFW